MTNERRRPDPHPCGMLDTYWVRDVTHEFPGYALLDMWAEETVIACGDQGLQAWRSLDDMVAGKAPEVLSENTEGVTIPTTGWEAVRSWCDQTGGMTMVDAIEFDNGCILCVSTDCACLLPDREAYNRVGEGDEATLATCWLPEGVEQRGE